MKLLLQMHPTTFLEVVRRHPRYPEGAPISGDYNAPTLMVIRPTNHFLLKQTWVSRCFSRNQLEISAFQRLKTPIFHETFASNASKNFFRGRKKASKVSRRCANIRGLQRINSHGHTTHQSFFIEANVSFKVFFKKSARNFCLSEFENTDFPWNFCFMQMHPKTFLEVVRRHPRYLEGAPTSGDYNAPTPMVIRPTNHFLFKKEVNPPSGSLFWKPLL